jgi:hypothetical protein
MTPGAFFVVMAGKKFVKDSTQTSIFLTTSYSQAFRFVTPEEAKEFVSYWIKMCPGSDGKFKIWKVDVTEVPVAEVRVDEPTGVLVQEVSDGGRGAGRSSEALPLHDAPH